MKIELKGLFLGLLLITNSMTIWASTEGGRHFSRATDPEDIKGKPVDYEKLAENVYPTNGSIVLPAGYCETALGAKGQSIEKVKIYSLEDVEKAIAEENANEETKNRVLIKHLEKMLALKGERYALGPPEANLFESLYEESPNHSEVISKIINRAKLARDSREAMNLEPILLLGEPGVGKTHFAKKLASVIGTSYQLISMNNLTAGWILTGNAASWRNSKPGKVSTGLIESPFANPVFVVDEIDKPSGSEYDPMGGFYNLLEPETSQEFLDEYIGVKINASSVLWIATANDESRIPEPILNRMNVFVIEFPSIEENIQILKNLYAKILADHPRWNFEPELRENVLSKMSTYPPRDSRRTLLDAIALANSKGRKYLVPEDIDGGIKTKRKMAPGFIQPVN